MGTLSPVTHTELENTCTSSGKAHNRVRVVQLCPLFPASISERLITVNVV